MNYLNMSIGEIVTHNFLASQVFKQYEIDFCCGGHKKLSEIIQEKNIDVTLLVQALNNLNEAHQHSTFNFKEWSLELLLDYVTKYHHTKIREKGPVLLKLCEKVANVHGVKYSELIEVTELYRASLNDLFNHLMKEDTILFPFIYQMIQASNGEQPSACFDSIEMPISVMMHEHDIEGERFRTISSLTQNYAVPDDACQSYRLMMMQLSRFEQDLHEHIHIENNIIFPEAIKRVSSS